MIGTRGANTLPMRKRLLYPFSQIVDHSLSFLVFLTFSLNKRWWRLPQFSFLEDLSLSFFFYHCSVVAYVATDGDSIGDWVKS